MLNSSPRWWSRSSGLTGYAVAVLAVALALGASLVFDIYVQSAPFVSLYMCAIMFAAWFGGGGPGLLAAALSALSLDYFFLPPFNSLSLTLSDIARLVLFVIAAIFVVSLSAAQRSTARSLRRARDDLQAAVHELERVNRSLAAENVERRRAEETSRRAERELQVTIDMLPAIAASYRADGSIDFVNQTWRDYTGLSQESLVGQRWGAAIHPDDMPSVERAWRAHLASGQPFEIEQRLRRSDGEYRWHFVRRVPLRDESGKVVRWYGVGHDIEDRKRVESALRRSEAYLAEAQRLSKTGSFGWKIGTNEIIWSEETFRMFDLDPAIKPSLEFILRRTHPDDAATVQDIRDRMTGGEQTVEFFHRLLLPDGTVKDVHGVAHATKDESGALEYVGVLMDVTAVKRAQDALEQAQAELAHVTRVATLGEISASIAHEVNQPLAAIATNGQASLRWLAREVPDIGEVADAVRQIIHDADRASEVIQKVRALSKKADPEMVAFDLNEVIDEVLALVRREAFSHRVTLRRQLAPDLPRVRGDRIQLQQVIINLVVNGIQAMATVNDREPVLVIRTQPQETGQVLLAVEDAGIGIEPENLDRLFKAFYTTKPNGLGMGLSICRSIVEAHGGCVWATRNAGPGMTFHLTIAADGQAAEPPRKSPAPIGDAWLSGRIGGAAARR
jgi:PAS domain S-box-containing protein